MPGAPRRGGGGGERRERRDDRRGGQAEKQNVYLERVVTINRVAKVVKGAEGDKTAKAKLVGALIAERAREAGISAVVFDRGGYQYHGRVAALADSAREAGLTL